MPSHTLCALTRLSPCIARFVFGRRRLDVCTVLDGGNTQPLSTLSRQDSLTRALKTSCHLELKIRWRPSPLLTSRHLWEGFEPTRGDPIGLAGRRLNRSAKVSSAKSASQLRSSPGSHATVSLCFLRPPHLAISPALTDSWEQCASAGNRTRVRWQRCILPLDHRCLWKIFGLDSYRLQIPCTPFSSSLHDTTFSRQSTPHFVALFQPPVRNPQETLGNPRKPSHSCSGNPEVTPLNAFTHPLRPYKAFSPCIARFVFGYWTEVTHNPWAHFPGKTAWRVRWRRHATWNSRSVGYPHNSLQVETCEIRTHAGRPHRLSRPTP